MGECNTILSVNTKCRHLRSVSLTHRTFLSKATDYFSHMLLQRLEAKIRRKESSPQPSYFFRNRSYYFLIILTRNSLKTFVEGIFVTGTLNVNN